MRLRSFLTMTQLSQKYGRFLVPILETMITGTWTPPNKELRQALDKITVPMWRKTPAHRGRSVLVPCAAHKLDQPCFRPKLVIPQ